MASNSTMDTSPSSEDTATTDSLLNLDPKYQDVTILALRMSSRSRLGLFLNMEAIPLHSGLLPNYQGLAELIGFEFIEQVSFQRERDPTQALLMEWGNRPELQPTLGNLARFLAELERLDVLEECREIIANDAKHYLERKAAGSSDINPVQDPAVSQSPFNIDDMKVDEYAMMTVQDVEAGRPTFYDAFVCYHPEGDDLKFVKELITRMECPPHNLRLFVPHRDDLPGASKYVISAKLIQDRCKRMVIVMSPRYLQSEACDFQTKFAHALSPGSRSKKLVPVLVTWCNTPNILRHVTMCDYTRGDMTGWFWERLIKSLQAPLNPHDITVVCPNDLSELEMNIQAEPTASFSPTTTTTTAKEGGGGLPVAMGGLSAPVVGSARTSPSASSSGRSTPNQDLSPSSHGDQGSGGGGGGGRTKKKGSSSFLSPLRQTASSTTPPSSPSPDSKSGPGGAKKKGFKSKLTSVFSSSSSSHGSGS
ncbi:myeloid differentiation primary response protein MyD88-like [Babylonia areolata]|uniref:myeloid differentiation primary response protein MyD88-like n=1 Tax=Babylonia areolata TaxID=304850 RepID=UPI003FD14ED4